MTAPCKSPPPVFSILILALACVLLSFSPARAVTPGDLIVVYNANLPDSQAVARHYAKVRGVPPANLLGVDVTREERMARADFEPKLAAPVRAAAQRLQKVGRTPVVVTVYGIPLIITGAPATAADQEFKSQAAARFNDTLAQLLQTLLELDAAVPPAKLTPERLRTVPFPALMKAVQETLARAVGALKRSRVPEDKRAQIITLATRLTGSPQGRGAAAAPAAEVPEVPAELDVPEAAPPPASPLTDTQALFWGLPPAQAEAHALAVRFRSGLVGELVFWERQNQAYRGLKDTAAVDGELTLVLAEAYHPAHWLPNPFLPAYDRLPLIQDIRRRTVMVSRLDGPTPAIARRLVDDAAAVDKTGLQGTFYIDARGLSGSADKVGSYPWFDRHLTALADFLKRRTKLKVVLDQNPAVFPPFSCPQAALYVGWYSLGQYVPSFQWVKGAVGYHVASAEATTLRDKGSRVWCKRLLEEGVAATLGPVHEPYLHSFPLPDRFFPLLLTGRLSLVEVYFRTVPFVSWMQVLIGDPLYTPFKAKPALGEVADD